MLNEKNTHIDEVRVEEDKVFLQLTDLDATVVMTIQEFWMLSHFLKNPPVESVFQDRCGCFSMQYHPATAIQHDGYWIHQDEYWIIEFGKECTYIRFRMTANEMKTWEKHLDKEYRKAS